MRQFNFKDFILSRLPYYYKEMDTYKNPEGKGLLERFINLGEEYLDKEVTPEIDSIVDIIDPDIANEVFINYMWEYLGFIPYAQGVNIRKQEFTKEEFQQWLQEDTQLRPRADYRSALKYAISLYKIRCTELFYTVLGRLYNLNIDLTPIDEEQFPETVFRVDVRYDEPSIKYDDVVSRYDTLSECLECVRYNLSVTSPDGEITPEEEELVKKIIERYLPVHVILDKVIYITYTLDYADPFLIRVEAQPGERVVLQSPEQLGFVIPPTHTFVAWTYLGEGVTEVVVPEDGVIIEGRVERLPGANLIRGSRFGSPIKEGGSLDESVDIRISLSGSVVQLQEYAEIRASTISVSAYPRPQSINRTYVWSIVSNTAAGDGRLSSNKPDVKFLKAWVNGELVFNKNGSPDIDGLFPSTSNHIIEILFTSEQPWLASNSVAISRLSGGSVRASLFKLEDVTGLPESEQRATAWIPHVDDPE